MAQGGKTDFGDFYDYQRSKQLIESVERDVLDLEQVFARFTKSINQFNSQFKKSLQDTTNTIKGNNQAIKALDKTQMEAVDAIIKYTKENEKLNKEGKETRATIQSIDQVIKNSSKSVNGQKELIKQLTAEFNKLDPTIAKDTVRLTELSRQLVTARNNVREMSNATRTSNNVLNRAQGSYNALTAAIRQDLEVLKNIPGAVNRNSAAYKQNAAQIETLQARIRSNTAALKAFDAQIGRSFRNVGNYQSALAGLGRTAQSFAGALGFAGGVFLLAQGVRQAVRNNIELSDSLANVRKTTDLTQQDVLKLADSLRKLNTRTSLQGLLEISTAAGRLDVANDQLVGFTEAIDKVVVALGDELEGTDEEIATTVARIVQVFGEEEQFGIAQAITRIGSGINELGKETKASGDFIVDFTQRLGGVAPQAGIAASEILGLGATFQELGQSPEVAASSVNRFLVQVGRDVPRFAALAGQSVEEFSELLRTDATEAFLRVVETAASTEGGIEALANSLDNLGIKQVRAISALGALANNTDRARRNIEIANEAVEEATSLEEEFAIKNETLAASYDKLINAFERFTTASEGVPAILGEIFKITTDFLDLISGNTENPYELIAKNYADIDKNTRVAAEAQRLYNFGIENGRKSFEDFKALEPERLVSNLADRTEVLAEVEKMYAKNTAEATKETKELTEEQKRLQAALEAVKGKGFDDLFTVGEGSELRKIREQADLTRFTEQLIRDAQEGLNSTGGDDLDGVIDFILNGGDADEVIDEFKRSLDEASEVADQFRDEEARKEQLFRDIIAGTFDVANAFADTFYTNQQIRLDNELRQIESRYEKEIKLAGDNKTKKEQLENELDAERRRIQKEQAEAQRRATLFSLGLKIPEAIITGLIQGGPPLAIIYGAIATAQLIAASAVEVPAFSEGTENAPGGTVLVNDGPRKDGKVKRELITTPTGKKFFFDTDKPVLTDMIPKGSKIDPRDISELTDVSNILKDYSPIVGQHSELLKSFENKVSGVTINQTQSIDYDKLGEVIARNMPELQQIIFEEGGKVKKATIKGSTKRITGRFDPFKNSELEKQVKKISKKLGL